MGLVVQAPSDALLALIAGPTGEGAANAAPADGGMFATLMASMLTAGNPDGSEGEGDSAALGLPLPPAPEQETKTSNDAALALLTATALVQFVPQSTTPTETVAEGGMPAIATIETAATALAGEAVTDAPAAEGIDTDAANALEPATNAEPGAFELPSEATTTVEGASATAAVEAPDPPPVTRTDARSDTANAETPTELPSESGVVRSVGNAENSNRSQSGQDNANFGERGEPRRTGRIQNTPRASAKGIEHAAANSPVGELRQPSDSTPLADVAAAPAPAPVEVPPQVDQVASTVFESVEVGAHEARLRLDPAEMGEVVIHIQSDGDGGIRVEIRAERPEAAQLLRDHTQDLSQLLGDRGLNLSDVNVGLGRGNSEQTSFGEQRRSDTPANGEFASILGMDEPASAARHNRLRSAYNPDGAHVYRV